MLAHLSVILTTAPFGFCPHCGVVMRPGQHLGLLQGGAAWAAALGSGGPDVARSCMLTQSQQRGPVATGTPDAVGAPLAQSAERLHGKEKVYGSIP